MLRRIRLFGDRAKRAHLGLRFVLLTMTLAQPQRQTRSSQSLVLMLGTGRCGLRALVELVNRQPDVHVTLAQPPLLEWKRREGRTGIAERLSRMRRDRTQRVIGDAAHFYLPYIDDAISLEPDLRVICLERSREEVVASYCRRLELVCPLPTNHWAEQLGDSWHHDPIWSRTYPQYDLTDREAGIRRFCDEYHAAIDDLCRRFPEHVRLFSAREALGSDAGQRSLLAFAGIAPDRQVLNPGLSSVTGQGQEPHPRRADLAAAGPLDPRRCVVLVPHTGQIAPPCEDGLRELERRGYPVRRVVGYAAIDQGRGQMATDALLEGFEETMWVDSDIGFDADAVERLRAHRQPIVCGIYPQKGRRVLSSHVMPGTPNIVFGQHGALVEVLYAGGGFLLVRRQVYTHIQRQLRLPVCNERFGHPMIPFFQPMVRPDDDGFWYLAEDWAFCERARQCGYRVMADTTIRLWHLGSYPFGWEDAGIVHERYSSFNLGLH
jgi:hypothetical protein